MSCLSGFFSLKQVVNVENQLLATSGSLNLSDLTTDSLQNMGNLS